MIFTNTKSPSVRFSGRWNVTDKDATTTAPGSMVECGFSGKSAVLFFDIYSNIHPYPHLWISVDGGAKVSVPLDKYIFVDAKDDGDHYVEIIFKSCVEIQHRWYPTLNGKITFLGFEAEAPAELPEDNRRTIEFIGDSITEGVLVDPTYGPEILDLPSRLHMDDITGTYGWLTAEKLGLKPIMMGYSGLALTAPGCGAVPPAEFSYSYCYHDVPYEGSNPVAIVVNHGANDRWSERKDDYTKIYADFLSLLRKRNKKALLVVLSPFCGAFAKELKEMVEKYNEEKKENILYINTTGWIPEEPLHPTRESHAVLAEKLSEILKDIL